MIDISDLTDLSTLGPFEVAYVWEDPDTHITFDFAVERLAAAIKRFDAHPVAALEVCEFPLTQEHCAFVRANRGVEEHRLASLRKLKEFPPILMAHMPDGSYLTLDGNHRTVVAGERGYKWMKFQAAEPELWRQFVIRVRLGGGVPQRSGL